MSTQVPHAMFVASFSPFTPYCNSAIPDNSCPFPIGNDGSIYSVRENTILSERGDVSASESSNVPILDPDSCTNESVTWSDFILCMCNDGSLTYERMSSEGRTAECLVGVSKSKILAKLENGKVWQPSSEC